MNNGFIRVAAAIPPVRVADCTYNTHNMLPLIEQATQEGAEIILFPLLNITSCSCGDLFNQQLLTKEAQKALTHIIKATANTETIVIAGMPIEHNSNTSACSIVIHKGTIKGAVPQKNNNIRGIINICEQQVPIDSHLLFNIGDCTFAITTDESYTDPTPLSTQAALAGAELIFCPTANHELAGLHNKLTESYTTHSRRLKAAIIYSSCGYGESTGDLVHGGDAFITENGQMLSISKRFATEPRLEICDVDVERLRHKRRTNKAFQSALANTLPATFTNILIERKAEKQKTLKRHINPTPFIPHPDNYNSRCEEILSIQTSGLMKRIEHTHSKTAIIGISGGLDSTLALLVTVRTFDTLKRSRKDIIGITMPGFGTTGRTYSNALTLMRRLGITMQEISIKEACIQHFNDIGHNINNHDVTYENSQARERTQILMDMSNRMNGLVVGTGDLSELALGWATYNGDHMSMYSVNASVPKTLVQHLVRHIALTSTDEEIRTTLLDIADTPISPELLPANNNDTIKQKTEDLVGPYELHDFFLYNFLSNGYTPSKIYLVAQQAFANRYDKETIKKWLTTFFRRFFTQQFKRSCMPDGPKVGSCSLSPRGDWSMPSDANSTLWLSECEKL